MFLLRIALLVTFVLKKPGSMQRTFTPKGAIFNLRRTLHQPGKSLYYHTNILWVLLTWGCHWMLQHRTLRQYMGPQQDWSFQTHWQRSPPFPLPFLWAVGRLGSHQSPHSGSHPAWVCSHWGSASHMGHWEWRCRHCSLQPTGLK